MIRTLLILLVLMTPSLLEAAEKKVPQQALSSAVDYLWSQQHADGSWRSEQYAMLRSGQALTPFVLHTLLESSDSLSSDEAEKALRAVRFIVSHLDDEGALGHSDPDILEYPVYSTAYAVMAIARMQRLGYEASTEEKAELNRHLIKMGQFLRNAQFDEASGFHVGMPTYGGWGFDKAKQSGEPGHMDLAHTRRAIDAVFRSLGLPYTNDGSSARGDKACRFLAVMQKHPETFSLQPVPEGVTRPTEIPFDGGFYFSPVVLAANKGRFDDNANCWRSYATATCDGILALLAAGVPKDDERVTAAVAWLKKHSNIDYPQGVPTDHPEPWGEAIQFYHYAARAEVYRALSFPAYELRSPCCRRFETPCKDGSFMNTLSPLMKEDEPLLATALAVVALTNCLP